LGVTPRPQTVKTWLFFTVMGAGGRALRGSAFAAVLRSTAHSSLRRSPPIPNAVVLSNARLYMAIYTYSITSVYYILLLLMANATHFLQVHTLQLLQQLNENTPAQWGILTPQHMLEHLRILLCVSTGKIKTKLQISAENLPKQTAFLWSDRRFKRNIQPPNFPKGKLLPLRYSSLTEAREKLISEIAYFYTYYQNNEGIKHIHPYFGNLDIKAWEQFHYKHFSHHFAQFGLLENA